MSKHLLILLIAVSLLTLFSCSEEISYEDPEPSSSLTDRTNPLKIFIRDNWTDGDNTSTGGLHYRHIKVAGHNWKNIGELGNGADQAEFVVDNFDLYIWGGPIVGDQMDGRYEDFIWISPIQGPYISSTFDSMETVAWLSDSSKNSEGYSWEDITMHFKYNWDDRWGNYFHGWNPADDPDGDGCRDYNEASDSSRTARCIGDSEIYTFVGTSGREWWNYLKIMHQGTHKMITDIMLENMQNQYHRMKGVYHDNRGMLENSDFGIQNSFTYENDDMLSANQEYYIDKLKAVTEMGINYIEPEAPWMNLHFCNMSSPYHICEKPSESKEWVFKYIENMRLENWLITEYNHYSYLYMTTDRRKDYLSCPYLNWLERGKGIIFCVKEYFPGSDRGRLFSLATFYMINHQLALYGYKAVGYPAGEHVSAWNWNPYVEFYIGQPAVNTLGLNDFQGNSGTDRYFVWKESAGYEILGREYLRDDGLRVLVLSKLMADGGREGADPITHELPGCYQSVQPDLTLGPPTREITLCNNEGAILVATDGCQAPPEADFSADRTVGFIPMTVEFTDLSENFPDSWDWDFGDGSGSSAENPIHIYEQPGNYKVTLTAANCDGAGTETKVAYIIVNENEDGGNKDDPEQP